MYLGTFIDDIIGMIWKTLAFPSVVKINVWKCFGNIFCEMQEERSKYPIEVISVGQQSKYSGNI